MNVFMYVYCSFLSRRTWILKHNLLFWPTWALTLDITSIRLYRSCYNIDMSYMHGRLPGSGHLPRTLLYMYIVKSINGALSAETL